MKKIYLVSIVMFLLTACSPVASKPVQESPFFIGAWRECLGIVSNFPGKTPLEKTSILDICTGYVQLAITEKWHEKKPFPDMPDTPFDEVSPKDQDEKDFWDGNFSMCWYALNVHSTSPMTIAQMKEFCIGEMKSALANDEYHRQDAPPMPENLPTLEPLSDGQNG